MVEMINKFSFILAPIFYTVLYLSAMGSIVGLLILAVREIFDKKIAPHWKNIIWMLLLVTLVIPIKVKVQTNSNYAVNSIVDVVEKVKDISYREAYDKIRYEQKIEEKSVEKSNLRKEQNKIYLKSLLFDVVLPYVWMIGMIGWLVMLVLGDYKIRKSMQKQPIEEQRILRILQECKEELKIRRDFKIYVQTLKKVPCLFGVFCPKILVTTEFLNYEESTIKHVILHELVHDKRKDNLVNYLLLLIQGIHWFNPFVWIYFKKIREDMELATDEQVISNMSQEEGKQYAMTLIQLVEKLGTEKYNTKVLCIVGENLKRRITMIKLSQKFKKNKMAITLISVCLIMIIASLCFIGGSKKEVQDNFKKESNNINKVSDRNVNSKDEYEKFIEDIDSSYKDIKDLPQEYNMQDAINGQVFVITHNEVYNQRQYEEFMKNIEKKIDAFIRIAQYTVEGDMILCDLRYESEYNTFTLCRDNTRDKWSIEADRTYFYDTATSITTEESGNGVILYLEGVQGKEDGKIAVCYIPKQM